MMLRRDSREAGAHEEQKGDPHDMSLRPIRFTHKDTTLTMSAIRVGSTGLP